jgi:hypothetical protein
MWNRHLAGGWLEPELEQEGFGRYVRPPRRVMRGARRELKSLVRNATSLLFYLVLLVESFWCASTETWLWLLVVCGLGRQVEKRKEVYLKYQNRRRRDMQAPDFLLSV